MLPTRSSDPPSFCSDPACLARFSVGIPQSPPVSFESFWCAGLPNPSSGTSGYTAAASSRTPRPSSSIMNKPTGWCRVADGVAF
eukprot:1492295-Rhodomonas_salina.1